VELLKKFNVSSVAVMGTNDETGLGFIKSMQSEAIKNKIIIRSTSTYVQWGDSSAIETGLKSIINSGQKIIVLQMFGVDSVVMQIASKLGILNGDYWIIGTAGIDERTLSFNVPPSIAKSFAGLWQVAAPLPYDEIEQGITKTAQEFRSWHRNLYNLDNTDPSKKGVAKGYDFRMISFLNNPNAEHFPNNCKNGSMLDKLARNVTNFNFPFVSWLILALYFYQLK
jgi:ABC-type branched-subunit amino acid transport system substrate-binding protein